MANILHVSFVLCAVMQMISSQGYVNVAKGKNCSQISTFRDQDLPENAANGNTGGIYNTSNCIQTDVGRNGVSVLPYQYPWWEVDLGGPYPVSNISIWARLGYEDHLYPYTITVDGQQCVTQASFVNTVTCATMVYGQVVRLTRTSRYYPLSFCELQIWVPRGVAECPAGHYGDQCDRDCNLNCGGGPGTNFCYKDTGVCFGCVARRYGDFCEKNCLSSECDRCDQKAGLCVQCNDTRFTGDNCTDCITDRYGGQCELSCRSQNCLNRQCDRATGLCTACSGNFIGERCLDCQAGYYSSSCQFRCQSTNCLNNECLKNTGWCVACPQPYIGDGCLQCIEGKYGLNCSENCGKCQNNASCHDRTGACNSCDEPGLKLPLCKEECDNGRYGLHCYYSCGQCKDGAVCDKVNGTCPRCDPGWTMPYCNTSCPFGRYGQDCAEECAKCQNNATCNYISGACSGCNDPGLKPNLCKEECDNGTYGVNCYYSCGQCKGGAVCDKANGTCPRCEPGWTMPYCNTRCQFGRYGQDCTEQCGNCRNNATCNSENGQCYRCNDAGVKFPLCKEECDNGSYGYQCSGRCGQCEDGAVCDKVNGMCPRCDPGWTMPYCNTQCPTGYFGQDCREECSNCSGRCNQTTGACYSCKLSGLQLPFCNKECVNGTYGSNCNYRCGQCKDGEMCDTVNGDCSQCQPGYQLPKCRSTCPESTFGYQCKQLCGSCRAFRTCHFNTGECPDGCVDGFTGSQCLETVNDSLIGPVVGSVVSVGVLVSLSIVGAICWRRRSRDNDERRTAESTSSPAPDVMLEDRGCTISDLPTTSAPRTVEENVDAPYEISDRDSTYDRLQPYSNDDGDREPYTEYGSSTAQDDTAPNPAVHPYVNIPFAPKVPMKMTKKAN